MSPTTIEVAGNWQTAK